MREIEMLLGVLELLEYPSNRSAICLSLHYVSDN